jgi:hypothetical protein
MRTMVQSVPRGIKEGISFGIVAGIIFAVVEVVVAGGLGQSGLMPLRMFASVVMGSGAMTTTEIAATVVVGVIVHFVLSALFGAIYGMVDARLDPRHRASWGSQAVFGMVYGVALWFVNFQIIARILYPWFLGPPQGLQMMMHALAFGLPLGLMFAATERRTIPTLPRSV